LAVAATAVGRSAYRLTRPIIWPKFRAQILFQAVFIFFCLSATARADFAAGWRAYQQGDYASALRHWTELAEAGYSVAQYNVGVMYDEGTGVGRDPAKVIAWWNKAAKQGHLTAQHNLALLFIEGGSEAEFSQAASWLQRAAGKGFAPSQYTLAKLYANGLGIETDHGRALDLFLKAGKAGFVKAQYNLGKIYRDGLGVPADPIVSLNWFRKAALQGYAKAQEKLALRYADDSSVKHDATEALMWAILANRAGRVMRDNFLFKLRESMHPDQIAKAGKRAEDFRPGRPGPAAGR